jgi:hypothetical protein
VDLAARYLAGGMVELPDRRGIAAEGDRTGAFPRPSEAS